jgi:hypothetical protein
MAIKIDGQKNTISYDNGDSVIVIPKLYLNKTEITGSGGYVPVESDTALISSCGIYP